MNEWIIKPHRSVGPISFGMTVSDVEGILGEAEFTDAGVELPDLASLQGASFVEFRVFEGGGERHTPAVEYKDGRVSSLEFFPHHTELRIGEIYLYKNAPRVTISLLMEMSSRYAFADNEFIFLDLGISMGIPEMEDENIINVFSEGEFDNFVEKNLKTGSVKLVQK